MLVKFMEQPIAVKTPNVGCFALCENVRWLVARGECIYTLVREKITF